MEGLLPFIHPEFEVTTPADLAAEPDTYRGPDGVRRYFDSFYEAMDEIRFEPREFLEAGGRVIVPITLTARGRTTGIEARQEFVHGLDAARRQGDPGRGLRHPRRGARSGEERP